MIKKFLERIFLTSIFMLVVSVFVGMAYELQVAQSPTAYAHKVISNNGSSIKQALFSPEDDVKSVLIGLINQEKKHISLAIFTLTDKDIAQALIDAYDRKVSIEIVTDRTTYMSDYSKIPLLAKKNITIYIYPQLKNIDKAAASLMHNKFIIFGNFEKISGDASKQSTHLLIRNSLKSYNSSKISLCSDSLS